LRGVHDSWDSRFLTPPSPPSRDLKRKRVRSTGSGCALCGALFPRQLALRAAIAAFCLRSAPRGARPLSQCTCSDGRHPRTAPQHSARERRPIGPTCPRASVFFLFCPLGPNRRVGPPGLAHRFAFMLVLRNESRGHLPARRKYCSIQCEYNGALNGHVNSAPAHPPLATAASLRRRRRRVTKPGYPPA
jgi:hypothetical protein